MNQGYAAGAAGGALNNFINFVPPAPPIPQQMQQEAQPDEGRVPPPKDRTTIYIEILTPNGHKTRGAEAYVNTRIEFEQTDSPNKIRKDICDRMGVSITSTFTYTLGGDAKKTAKDFNTNKDITDAKNALLARNKSARVHWNQAICVHYKGDASANAAVNIVALEQDPALQAKRMRVLEDFRCVHNCAEHPDRFCVVNPNTNQHVPMPQVLLNQWTMRVAQGSEDPNNFPVWKNFRDWKASVETIFPSRNLQAIQPPAILTRTPVAPIRTPAFAFRPPLSDTPTIPNAAYAYGASLQPQAAYGGESFHSAASSSRSTNVGYNSASSSTAAPPSVTPLLDYGRGSSQSMAAPSPRSASHGHNSMASSSGNVQSPRSTSALYRPGSSDRGNFVKKEKLSDTAIMRAIFNESDSDEGSSDFEILSEGAVNKLQLAPGIPIFDVLVFCQRNRPDWDTITLLPAFKLNKIFYVEDLLDTATSVESLVEMDERVTSPIARYILSAAQAMRDQATNKAVNANRLLNLGSPLTSINGRATRKPDPRSPEPTRDVKRRHIVESKENQVVVKPEPMEDVVVPKIEYTEITVPKLAAGSKGEPIDIPSSDD